MGEWQGPNRGRGGGRDFSSQFRNRARESRPNGGAVVASSATCSEGWPYLGKEWDHESDFLGVVPHFRRDEAEDDEIFEGGGVVLGDEVYHVL